MKSPPNPFELRKALKRDAAMGTLAGGKAGQDNQTAAVSSATPSQAASMGTALDALSAMFCGLVGRDRELLDSGFEDLVGVLEEWRDEIPKNQQGS